ncbi:uncharacterized protein IWZ02DRAFT_493879 [Phyllosticta citriasiana]|uniref:Uncharacterized protein n=1 Tax=Phyllosticta citriasiana TaxID=595635 RepID=A0ABR1L002_9PEZI
MTPFWKPGSLEGPYSFAATTFCASPFLSRAYSYLQALYLRLQHLEAIEAHVAPQLQARAVVAAANITSPSRQPTTFPSLASNSPSVSEGSSTSLAGSSNSHPQRLAEIKTRYEVFSEWGPSSAMAHLRLVTTLLNVQITRPLHRIVPFPVDIPSARAPVATSDAKPQLPPFQTSQFLLEFYYQCVDRFQPILGKELGDRDLEQLYAGRGTPETYRSCTRARLALAIAARCLFRSATTQGTASQSQAYLEISDEMFDAAVSSLRIVFQDSNSLLEVVSSSAFENEEAHAMQKLQIVLLMVCYVLTAPGKGNIWQLLGFAERLWRSIQNARSQLRRSSGQAQLLNKTRSPPNLLYTSFISLERMIGMAFGRPIDFLEFAEDDEPTYAPGDKTIPALHAAMLEMRQNVHATFLRCTGPQESRRGILSSIDETPGSLEWYFTIRKRADEWFKQWQESIEQMSGEAVPNQGPSQQSGDGSKDFLVLTGCKFRDETLHLAFCLVLQKSASAAQQVQGGPIQSPFGNNFRFRRRVPVLPPDLLAEGRGIVHRLTSHLTRLLRRAFYIQNPPSLRHVPLVFPRTWIADVEIFRVAVTAAYLSKCSLSQDERGGTRIGNREMDMTWEVASCIKLLNQTSAEVNTEGLTEAVLSLVQNDGDSTM